MVYKILIRNENGSMDFASERIKRDDGSFYFADFETKDFDVAKEKFIDLLDLYKITQLKIVADLQERLIIDFERSEDNALQDFN